MSCQDVADLQEKLKQIARIAVWFQVGAMAVAAGVLYFKPYGFRELGQSVSILSLMISFCLSRWLIYNGTKLESLNDFSAGERRFEKNRYFVQFFGSYIVWLVFLSTFSKM